MVAIRTVLTTIHIEAIFFEDPKSDIASKY